MTCADCKYIERVSTMFICTNPSKSMPNAYTEILPLYEECEFFVRKDEAI
jgi:ribonucleotide monophosphatase NagD (HAD superfamily)